MEKMKGITGCMKPILFNTEMVRAILAGQKTTTRRLVKGASAAWSFKTIGEDCAITAVDRYGMEYPKDVPGLWATFEDPDGDIEFPMIKAPYQPGDILYCRETWAAWSRADGIAPTLHYKADGESLPGVKWRPSIHMPKEAARIFLKVKNVGVERLQDITPMGIEAEGFDISQWYEYDEWQHAVGDGCASDGIPVVFETLPGLFGHRLWDSTMTSLEKWKSYGWDANPWVYVIEFERIEKEALDA